MKIVMPSKKPSLRESGLNAEFVLVRICCKQTEYGDVLCKILYSGRI